MNCFIAHIFTAGLLVGALSWGCGKDSAPTAPDKSAAAPAKTPLGGACERDSECIDGAVCSYFRYCEIAGPCWARVDRLRDDNADRRDVAIVRYEYDAKGRMTLREEREGGETRMRLVRTISDDGRRYEKKLYVSGRDEPVHITTTLLDENERRLWRTIEQPERPERHQRYVFRYDPKSTCKVASNADILGKDGKNRGREEVDCNDRGQPVAERTYEGENLTFELAFEYDARGLLAKMSSRAHVDGQDTHAQTQTVLRREDGVQTGSRDDRGDDGSVDSIERMDWSCWTITPEKVTYDASKAEPGRGLEPLPKGGLGKLLAGSTWGLAGSDNELSYDPDLGRASFGRRGEAQSFAAKVVTDDGRSLTLEVAPPGRDKGQARLTRIDDETFEVTMHDGGRPETTYLYRKAKR